MLPPSDCSMSLCASLPPQVLHLAKRIKHPSPALVMRYLFRFTAPRQLPRTTMFPPRVRTCLSLMSALHLISCVKSYSRVLKRSNEGIAIRARLFGAVHESAAGTDRPFTTMQRIR
jgi:hypothetical protein